MEPLRRYRNGDRYLYCDPLIQSIPREQRVCGFYCTVFHHGRDNSRVCKSCTMVGHKTGDPACPALPEEDSILTFSGYQHVLSNHYMTPISAFNIDVPFKSVEHAFFFKMATDLGYHELAERIKNAEHAGVVKRLSKNMEENDRRQWEEDNMDVMKELIAAKARTCDLFKQCLIMNKDKVLAEATGTGNKRWGTGLSKWITEKTKPNCWPGANLMGAMLMSLTEELLRDTDDLAMEIQNDGSSGTEDEDEDDELENTQHVSTLSDQNAKSKGNSEISKKAQKKENSSTQSWMNSKPKPKKKPSKEKSLIKGNPPTRDNVANKNNKTSDTKTPNKDIHSTQRQASSSGKGKPGGKETNISPGKGFLPTIKHFFNPTTGKRKSPDTTPEKNNKEKETKLGS